MKKILCVCFGNSCRSPMMKVLLVEKLKKAHINAFVDSAGIAEKAPTPASDNAKKIMREVSLSLKHHMSKHVREVDLSYFDFILVVDQKTKDALLEQGAQMDKIIILNENQGGIPNPFGKDLDAYRECSKVIYNALQNFTETLA